MKAALLLTDGAEETEAVATLDVLRRAGIEVSAAGMKSLTIKCSRRVLIGADILFDKMDFRECNALILPGGMAGTESLMSDSRVIETVRQFNSSGKLICAICAAPLVLQEAGVITGRTVTCHPSVADRIVAAKYVSTAVHLDGNILTSQGPGTAFEFALKIVEILIGKPAALQIRKGLVLDS